MNPLPTTEPLPLIIGGSLPGLWSLGVATPAPMSFGQLLTAPQVLPFTLALGLFALIAVAEIVMALTGMGGDFGLDLDLPTEVADVADAAAQAAETTSGWLLDWLGIGRVPYLVSLAAFLLAFGVLGLFVQDIQLELIGHALPWPLAAIGVTIITLPLVRLFNFGLGRIWPKDVETSAVSQDSLIGHEAEVVLGTVSAESPGQIKVRDPQGTTHYGLATADVAGEQFTTGERLLIVARRGATFLVIRHPNPSDPTQHSDN